MSTALFTLALILYVLHVLTWRHYINAVGNPEVNQWLFPNSTGGYPGDVGTISIFALHFANLLMAAAALIGILQGA